MSLIASFSWGKLLEKIELVCVVHDIVEEEEILTDAEIFEVHNFLFRN